MAETSKKEFETVEEVLEEYLPAETLKMIKAEDEEKAATTEAKRLLKQFRQSLQDSD